MTYLLNGVDISDIIFGEPSLTKKVGKGTKTYTNNLSMDVINEDNILSPENEESLVYNYRDDYSKLTVEVKDGDVVIWSGVVDNIEREEQKKIATITCVESIISILDSSNFSYYYGDGYVGVRAYAGDDVTPAVHQLAVLRRYLDDEFIDIGSLKVLKEVQGNNSITVRCEVMSEDKITPMSFLNSLMMDMGYFVIEDNKISARWYETFTGDMGIQLKDDHIIKITNISKSVEDDVYYSFNITYDNSGTATEVEGSFGDSGTSTDTTSTTLTDSTKEWDIDQWRNKFVFVGSGTTKEILKISSNNKTTLYFQNCTKSGAQNYVIVENSEIYEQDYSDYPIKLTSGAAALGAFVVSRAPQSKLQIDLEILDTANVNVGDSLLLNIPDEGIEYQSFEVTKLQKKLESGKSTITCLDNSIYPLLEAYEMTVPTKVTNLTGFRVEGDGSAMLSWDAVSGASYYRVYYGVSGRTYTYITTDNSSVNITNNMEKWLGYYFWVSAVNFYGIEGELSDSLYLGRVTQDVGYIDGTDGYLTEDFINWGLLEDYHYLLTYKNIGYGDIGFLLKCPIDVLDRSQSTFTQEITQPFEDEEAVSVWGSRFRRLGYTDGAGTSTYLPELLDDSGTYKIQNPLSKPLTLNLQSGKTTFAAGAEITGSEDWFLKDGADNYYTYWFQTGLMMDIKNPDTIEWFKVWKINQTMGIWESGDSSIVNNEDTGIGTLTDTSKSWNTNQWEDYYVGIVNDAETLDIDWYQIKSNTGTTLTFDYGDDDLTGQTYIINNEPYIGFHGIFVDDIWTALYMEGIDKSTGDSGSAEDVAVDYLYDSDKAWMANYDEGHWEGFYVSINGQTPVLITWSDNDTLYFSGNPTTGTDLSYEILTKFEVDNGVIYAEAMADFIEIIVEKTENNSYSLFRNWERCERGIFMLNTWPDDFSYYDDFVAAVNKRFQHFVMFEALQMTWNMDNEVTKQFIVLDWHEAVTRWGQMKISAGIGNARLAILGYPYNQQMMLTHIAGSLLMTNYGNNSIEDITASGNIVLDQLFYDMIMAGNEDNNKTVGFPESGYESSYIQNQYDRYGICYRQFEGCHVFYNPSRQFRTLEYQFSEDVVNYFTGETFTADTLYKFVFPPRTPIFFFRSSAVGTDALNFLSQYLPYTYLDFNMAWIVFTTSGATAIGTNSVWIVNGYTGNKRFVLDGSPVIPEGEIEKLFHAGDGSYTGVTGHNPSNEVLTGSTAGSSLLMTSKTILAIVEIIAGGSSWVVEDSGTDTDGYAGEGWLEDYTKSWITDEWAGKYVMIEGTGPYLITGNSSVELWLATGYSPEGNVNYEIGYTDVGSPTPLVPGTDFLVEHKEWDASASGKGKWNTYIYLLTDQSGTDLTTYYYEQGTEDGWPKMIESGLQVEHGVLYRKNSGFALKTGAVNESAASTTLVEGTDYYIIPELVRHKWDYRLQPYTTFDQDETFNAEIPLNMVYAVGGNSDIRGIHWGIIDADNAILVNVGGSNNNSLNGSKATYSSKTITRPKILIYGFTAPPRNEDTLAALAPASRSEDVWTFEYQISKYVGIYYDAVYVTGNWDGVVESGASTGQWGSVQGIIDDAGESFNSWQDVADYFDVIIINDTFIEYGAGSVSGKTQWASWLNEVDYNLIKNFKKRARDAGRNTILIDRRMGASAFVWWGGTIAVQTMLLNKGSDLGNNGVTKYSDLTNVFGCLYYGGQEVSTLSNSSSNVYTKSKSDNYVKFSTKMTTDYRIGKITPVTDHYTFDEEEENNHPILNVWENGGSYISYIPKSEASREYIPEANQMRETANIYVKWLDLSSLESGDGNFVKYAIQGLNNIILRRENLLIYHYWNFFNIVGYGGGTTWGNNQTYQAIAYPSPILGNYGSYRGCFFSKTSRSLGAFFENKTIYFRESSMSDYEDAFSFSNNLFSGYKGQYISSVESPKYTYSEGEHDDFGFCKHSEWTYSFTSWWGWYFYADSGGIDWGDVICFDSWNDDVGENYNLSLSTNAKGLFPYLRNASEDSPLEGAINSIIKNGDTLIIDVNMDVSPIDTGDPENEGTISDGKYSPTDLKDWYLKTNINVSAYRNGNYYIYITTSSGVEIYHIQDMDKWKQPPETMPSSWLSIRHSVGDPDIFNGCEFEIRVSFKAFRVATFLTNSDNNLLFNASVLSKDEVNDRLTVYCPRGVDQTGAGGYLIAYMAEDNEEYVDEETQESKTRIANKDVLGGRVTGIDDELGADIAETFRPDGELVLTADLSVADLDNADIKDKPLSMFHYEWVYKNLIIEFGYEKNTGLVACHLFYAHAATNRPPVLIWPGMSEDDFHTVIAKQIGTKIIFNNLQVSKGDVIYFYYNSFNDMLRIKADDVENNVDGHFKVGTLKSSDGTLIIASVRNLEE